MTPTEAAELISALEAERDAAIELARELRAYQRRSDEALRTVAEFIRPALASWHEGHGVVDPKWMASLESWLRRSHVRVVCGDPKRI